jgi:hypothetical protein
MRHLLDCGQSETISWTTEQTQAELPLDQTIRTTGLRGTFSLDRRSTGIGIHKANSPLTLLRYQHRGGWLSEISSSTSQLA